MRWQPSAGRLRPYQNSYQTLRGRAFFARAPAPFLWCYTSAMFCPQCRVEYRPGFTHCTDCDVDLVYELPRQERADAEPEEEISLRYEIMDGEEFRPLADFRYSTFCADACIVLKDAGIPY